MNQVAKIGGYEVLEALRRGGMGEVYKARRSEDGKLVVIKMLSKDVLADEVAVGRFQREVRSAIQIDHPSFPLTYDVGQHEGRWWYAMEFIEGTTVADDILRSGPYDENWALTLAEQAAEGLAYAGQLNLVHRDIKPENLMLAADGRVRLLDMGLAKTPDTQQRLTIVGTTVGTPHYMSPEQANCDPLDFRTDMYSLGATLFHMLTGRPPFHSESPVEVLEGVLYKEAPSPSEFNPRISVGACQVVGRMLAKKPADRYPSYEALIADIRKARDGTPTGSTKRPAASSTPARDRNYKFSHVPSEKDVIFGKAALRNGLLDQAKLQQVLDVQEKMTRLGARLNVAEVVLHLELLPADKIASLVKAVLRFEIETARDTFVQVGRDHDLIDARRMAAAKSLQRAAGKSADLPSLMLDHGLLELDRHESVLHYQKQSRRAKEDQAFLKVAVDSKFVLPSQVDKARVIHENLLVMGQYQDVGQILCEKGFMKGIHKAVILRAIRRHQILVTPIAALIEEQVLTQTRQVSEED